MTNEPLPTAIPALPAELTRESILIYGASGTHKTRQILSGYPNIRMLDTDGPNGGRKSLFNRKTKTYPFHIDTATTAPELQKFLRSLTPGQHTTVFIDGINGVMECIGKTIRAGKGGKSLTLQDWGRVVEDTKMFLTDILQCSPLLIATCYEITEKEAEGEIVRTRPEMDTKKIPLLTPYWFDNVFHAAIIGNSPIWTVRNSGKILAKNRLGIAKDIIPASFESIKEYLMLPPGS